MIKRGNLNVPVIGVAKAGWTIEQLRERARDGIQQFGGGVDEAAFAKLVSLLKYIDGDYQDPKTFEQLRIALAGAASHALSGHSSVVFSPPSWKPSANPTAPRTPASMIEKPFGHDLASAQKLNEILQPSSRE